MGRDIAGEREMRRTHGRRVSGLEALVVEGKAATPSASSPFLALKYVGRMDNFYSGLRSTAVSPLQPTGGGG